MPRLSLPPRPLCPGRAAHLHRCASLHQLPKRAALVGCLLARPCLHLRVAANCIQKGEVLPACLPCAALRLQPLLACHRHTVPEEGGRGQAGACVFDTRGESLASLCSASRVACKTQCRQGCSWHGGSTGTPNTVFGLLETHIAVCVIHPRRLA